MGSCMQKNTKNDLEVINIEELKEVIANFPKLIDIVSNLKDQVDLLEKKKI